MDKFCKKHNNGFKTKLKASGLKITPARLNLLDVFKHVTKPVSVKDLVRKLGKGIDVVTLYRNVESLENLGVLKKVWISDKENFYELSSNKHHHHLVCKNCGRVSDIENCKVNLPKSVLSKAGFAEISQHSLEFFGLCKSCTT